MMNVYPVPAADQPARAPYWVDLNQPTPEEIARVAKEFGVTVPSRDKLEEIESSSRLRVEGTRLYLSVPLSARQDLQDELPPPVGFILSPEILVTVRYIEMPAFNNVQRSIANDSNRCQGAMATFATLLEELIDFGADLLEKLASDLSGTSRSVFRKRDDGRGRGTHASASLRGMLVIVGDAGEQLSQIRESVTGLQRIIGFTSEVASEWLEAGVQARLKTMRRDLTSLADFEAHLSGKSQFLLDAILGFINTDQNEIFKVLTIASVVGIPPTLIASLYGMNFHDMPELSWKYGYQYGLTLIGLSTLIPILWFKWRRWW
jgi:magnesium transporter